MSGLTQSIQARREMLAAWRTGQKHDLELPSGLKVIVRDATVMDLVINGSIPQSLMDLIMTEGQNNGVLDLSKLSGTADFGKMINALAMICVVDPPLAELGDEEHLGLDELPAADKMAIMDWANREVGQVKTFPDGTGQPVDAAQPG